MKKAVIMGTERHPRSYAWYNFFVDKAAGVVLKELNGLNQSIFVQSNQTCNQRRTTRNSVDNTES